MSSSYAASAPLHSSFSERSPSSPRKGAPAADRRWTLRGLAADLRSGAVSSVDLVQVTLERIGAYRAAGGTAYVGDIDAGSMLQAAIASDALRKAGPTPSLVAGVPVSIKDLFDVCGQVTGSGARVMANSPPAADDARAVARLRAAGAILAGRTNMSEFAFSGLGLNPHYGTPAHPSDPEQITGGSSSGAVATVALGLAAAALGTDTGGSIRIPAAFCGLTGFKPTACRVPLAGAFPLSRSLDSAGPIANSVDCCAILDAVLTGEALDTREAPLCGLRLGWTRDYVMDDVEPAVAEAFDRALHTLSAAGAQIVPFDFPELRQLPQINAAGGLIAAEAWQVHRARLGDPSLEAQYDPRVAQRIRRGAAISAADYIDLQDARASMQRAADTRLRGFDAWLMPTVAVQAPRLSDLAGDDQHFFALNGLVLRNTTVINFLDGCALSLPCQSPGRPPVGLSVAGLHGADARILQVGRAVESCLQAALHSI